MELVSLCFNVYALRQVAISQGHQGKRQHKYLRIWDLVNTDGIPFHCVANAAVTVWFTRLRQRSACCCWMSAMSELLDVPVGVHIIAEVLLIGLWPLWL